MKPFDDDNDSVTNNSCTEDILDLANHHINEAISSAFNALLRICSSPCISLTTATTTTSSLPSFQSLSIPAIGRTLQPNLAIRCRSSSRNNKRERKVAFHHTIPRCSLPATTNDLVQFRSHFLSYQRTTYGSSQNVNNNNNNNNCSNRSFDVQYSYSLNQPRLTKIDKKRHNLISIQNFVNELIEHSKRAAFLQIDYQHLANNSSTSVYDDDTSCLLFDCSPSYAPIERFQIINAYADQFVQSIVQQSIESLSPSNTNLIERFSNRLAENVIHDALSTVNNAEIYSKSLLTDDEKQSRKTRKRPTTTIRLINNENNDTQATSLFHQIRHRSSTAFRSISNNNSRRETIDSIVNNVAKQIYIDSFFQLRRIYQNNNHK